VSEPIQAAGALLWRPGEDGPEVLVVHRPRYDDWTLPKGKLDPGEHVTAAAVREVFEETGHRIVLDRPLPTLHYEVEGLPKVVWFWAARADDGAPEWNGTAEIAQTQFVSAAKADRLLSYPRDVDVIEAFLEDPEPTAPLLVLRHAKSVARKAWDGTDRDRPLSDLGEEQARSLVPVLLAYGVDRVVSSPSLRCVQSLVPYAETTGLEIQADPALSEESPDPVPVVQSLLKGGRRTVLCSHRPLLPDIVGAAGVDHGPGTMPTGSFVAIHVRDGAAVAVEQHGPGVDAP